MAKKKDIFKQKLQDGNYEAFYLMSDGTVLNAFETSNTLDYDDSIGGVYYAIYYDGEEQDGGLMEYSEGSTLADFNDFVEDYHGISIVKIIAAAGDDLYDELDEAIDDPEEFTQILEGIGKKRNEPKFDDVGKISKWRGEEKWSYGRAQYNSKEPVANIEKDKNGGYVVTYGYYYMPNGQRMDMKGLKAKTLEEMNDKIEHFSESNLPILNPYYVEIKPLSENDFWYHDMKICPNCGSDMYTWKDDANVQICSECGCSYTSYDQTILPEHWDHKKFDEYRKNTEQERESWFKGGKKYKFFGNNAYTPENFDRIRYGALFNYDNPKDRSKILNFNLRRKRR